MRRAGEALQPDFGAQLLPFAPGAHALGGSSQEIAARCGDALRDTAMHGQTPSEGGRGLRSNCARTGVRGALVQGLRVWAPP